MPMFEQNARIQDAELGKRQFCNNLPGDNIPNANASDGLTDKRQHARVRDSVDRNNDAPLETLLQHVNASGEYAGSRRVNFDVHVLALVVQLLDAHPELQLAFYFVPPAQEEMKHQFTSIYISI